MRPALGLIVVLALAPGCGGREEARHGPAVPDPRAHFEPHADAPDRPPRLRGRHLTARVTRAIRLRARPEGRRLAKMGARTEFGSPTVLAVTRRRGRWLEVIAAPLANHRRAWIPASAVRLGSTDLSIRVDRSARRAVLRRGSRVLRRVPVAVGRPGNETPLGRFAVTDKLRVEDPDSPYGCCAIALSGHQTRLVPGWPGGDRLAFHGTPQPETIGRPVSLGCMRARASDLRELMRRVPLGAPVVIRA